jgi:hypothetical protein
MRMTSTAFELISSPVVFVVLYLFLVIPTYILPYFGSNSLIVHGLVNAAGASNPFFLAPRAVRCRSHRDHMVARFRHEE